MTVTPEFLKSVVEGIQALRWRAAEMGKTPEYKEANGVGNILRARVEGDHQCADMLAGWVKRNQADCGFPPDQFDI